MAATLTLVSASPDALKYRYAYDGAGSQTAVRTQAQMTADAQTAGAGPLLQLLRQTFTQPQWTALPEGKLISVTVTPIIVLAAAEQIGIAFTQLPIAQMNVNGFGQSNGSIALVEIRFHHTIDR